MRWWYKCAVLRRDEVGDIHFHVRRWPGRTGEIWFIPDGTHTAHRVPLDRVDEIARCKTMLEVMAVIRRS
jgi:hypothetical protein